MSDDSKEESVVDPPKIEEVKEELDDKGDKLTHHDLEALRAELKAELASVRSNRATDDEEKAELRAKIEKQEARIDELLKAQEEHDKVRSDSSTIILPPEHLDPKQQNPPPPEPETETSTGEKKKKRLGWY